MIIEIKLPEISENVASGEVAKILVTVGDTIKVDQPIVEVETDKAVVEVPATVAGKVVEIAVEVGGKVLIGGVIIKVETDADAPAAATVPPEKSAPAPTPPPPAPPPSPVVHWEEPQTSRYEGGVSSNPPPAAPSVRGLARSLGVDITRVRGTGEEGRISADDVKNYVRDTLDEAAGKTSVGLPERPLPDFTRWGEIERKPMSKVRLITADGLSYSWTSIPHVTQCESADMTELERFRKTHALAVEKAGGRLTVSVLLVKVIATALHKFPQFNSSVDMRAKELIFKKYIHVGVAVDTDRGLLVPVIKDADRKSLTELGVELHDLAERTRNHKILPDEMDGGTFTLSNLGSMGGTHFTPIIYPPQVAILGAARAVMQPVWKDNQWAPRLILPLALSYDHRIIDGADGARFIRYVAEMIEQPLQMFL